MIEVPFESLSTAMALFSLGDDVQSFEYGISTHMSFIHPDGDTGLLHPFFGHLGRWTRNSRGGIGGGLFGVVVPQSSDREILWVQLRERQELLDFVVELVFFG